MAKCTSEFKGRFREARDGRLPVHLPSRALATATTAPDAGDVQAASTALSEHLFIRPLQVFRRLGWSSA